MDSLSNSLRRTRRRLAWARWGDAAFVAVAAGGGSGWVAWAVGAGGVLPGMAMLAAFFAVWRPAPSLHATAGWLDCRHDLDDLLASAWSVRGQSGPWALTLRAMANARVAGLPRADRLARFSARHHACLIAAMAALLLTGRLFNPASADAGLADDADPLAGAVAVTDEAKPSIPLQIAADLRRAGDTADSGGRLPTPTAPPDDQAGDRSPRPARSPGDAANGSGRADTDRPVIAPALPPAASEGTALAPGPAGSGRAAAPGDAGAPAGGRVDPMDSPTGPPSPAGSGASNPAPAAPTPAAPVPAAYRDLVRDYFTR